MSGYRVSPRILWAYAQLTNVLVVFSSTILNHVSQYLCLAVAFINSFIALMDIKPTSRQSANNLVVLSGTRSCDRWVDGKDCRLWSCNSSWLLLIVILLTTMGRLRLTYEFTFSVCTTSVFALTSVCGLRWSTSHLALWGESDAMSASLMTIWLPRVTWSMCSSAGEENDIRWTWTERRVSNSCRESHCLVLLQYCMAQHYCIIVFVFY